MLTQVLKKFILFFCVITFLLIAGCSVSENRLQGSVRESGVSNEYEKDIVYLNTVVKSLNELGEYVYEDHDHLSLYLDVNNPDIESFKLFCNSCKGCEIDEREDIERIKKALSGSRPQGKYKDIQSSIEAHFLKVDQFYLTYNELTIYLENRGYENDEYEFMKQAVNEIDVLYGSITSKDSEIIAYVSGYQKDIREEMRGVAESPLENQALYMEDTTDLVIGVANVYYENWNDLDALVEKNDELNDFLGQLHVDLDRLDYGEYEFEKHVFEKTYCEAVNNFINEMDTFIEDLRSGKVTEENISDYDSKINILFDRVIESHNNQTEIQLDYGQANFFEPML